MRKQSSQNEPEEEDKTARTLHGDSKRHSRTESETHTSGEMKRLFYARPQAHPEEQPEAAAEEEVKVLRRQERAEKTVKRSHREAHVQENPVRLVRKSGVQDFEPIFKDLLVEEAEEDKSSHRSRCTERKASEPPPSRATFGPSGREEAFVREQPLYEKCSARGEEAANTLGQDLEKLLAMNDSEELLR